MKTRLNVTKSEAKHIWFSEGNKYIPSHYGLKNKDTTLCIYNSKLQFSDDNVICMDYNHSSEYYKDYEWRLTDIKDLEQGDLILLTGGFNKYYRKNYILTVFDNENFCWQIRENRPEKIKIFCNVYKLFKKIDKK
jgi:hypothetical protein